MDAETIIQRIAFKRILCLSDFSDASELALPFAINLSRAYGAKIFALHVLTPIPIAYVSAETSTQLIDAVEEGARTGMQRLDSQLSGIDHETLLLHGESVWNSVSETLKEHDIDLIVLGTHGRTGASKLLMGSVAEEIFRKCKAPVLTIGPSVNKGMHNGGRFQSVLFATDFGENAEAALPYAVSIAEESQAKLYLLHVLPRPVPNRMPKSSKESVADAMHHLQLLVPKDAQFWCRPEAVVWHGEPGDSILQTAKELGADLIVMGIRGAGKGTLLAAHLANSVTYKVVTRSACPVLTRRY
ncbi:MAG TPA: universal stress protein [Candidatus Eremiobacteraceae bacterium]|nr:universal stress protein [Candidatus Eremiobacteraceae bacterium]